MRANIHTQCIRESSRSQYFDSMVGTRICRSHWFISFRFISQASNGGSTLRVLFNSEIGDANGDANEFSGTTFVTTFMLLVINMISDDLDLSVELLLTDNGSKSVDIYVDDNNNITNVELLWPHYQNRYCFIYSNIVRISPHEMLHEWGTHNVSIAVSWILGWIFYCIILFVR